MTYVASRGYPVPRIHSWTDTDLVMDRVDGPTMLADLARRPWRLGTHARTLADLHRRLAAIPAPEDFPPRLDGGGHVVHLDLHPQNVILAPSGPVVIDWPNAGRGEPLADVAFTWVVVTTSDPEGPLQLRLLVAALQRAFGWAFLRGFDRREVFAHLPAVVSARLADRNVLPGERARLQRLRAAHGF